MIFGVRATDCSQRRLLAKVLDERVVWFRVGRKASGIVVHMFDGMPIMRDSTCTGSSKYRSVLRTVLHNSKSSTCRSDRTVLPRMRRKWRRRIIQRSMKNINVCCSVVRPVQPMNGRKLRRGERIIWHGKNGNRCRSIVRPVQPMNGMRRKWRERIVWHSRRRIIWRVVVCIVQPKNGRRRRRGERVVWHSRMRSIWRVVVRRRRWRSVGNLPIVVGKTFLPRRGVASLCVEGQC